MKDTTEIIQALSTLSDGINPTIIYNEGWMIRLLVIESMHEKLKVKNIDFGILVNKNWSSEALIASPFVKAEKNREGYTHADIILGDFCVNYGKRGEVELKNDPKILGIIEAKMGSNLSQGTSNSEGNYNQASRGVCCLSHVTQDCPSCDLFFLIAAPEETIKNYKFEKQIDFKMISKQIKDRFMHSEVLFKPEVKMQMEKSKIIIISYEDWLSNIRSDEVRNKLVNFYHECLKHNKIKTSN